MFRKGSRGWAWVPTLNCLFCFFSPPLSTGSGAVRRFGLNQTSWISLHNWEGERKRFGGWRGSKGPKCDASELFPKIHLATYFSCMFVLFPISMTDFPGSVSLLFITAFHTLSFQLYALPFPLPLKPPSPRPCLSLSLSTDRSIWRAIKPLSVTFAPTGHHRSLGKVRWCSAIILALWDPWDALLQDAAAIFDCLIFVLLGGRVVFEGILLKIYKYIINIYKQ